MNTWELLVEDGGFLYDSDACNDELPYFVDVKGTPFLVLPLTVGIHTRWTGQPSRAAALRRFIEYVMAKEGACFMRRVDIAQFWTDKFG